MTTANFALIDFVPDFQQLDHIRYLRAQVAWADRKLDDARHELREYEEEIRRADRDKRRRLSKRRSHNDIAAA